MIPRCIKYTYVHVLYLHIDIVCVTKRGERGGVVPRLITLSELDKGAALPRVRVIIELPALKIPPRRRDWQLPPSAKYHNSLCVAHEIGVHWSLNLPTNNHRESRSPRKFIQCKFTNYRAASQQRDSSAYSPFFLFCYHPFFQIRASFAVLSLIFLFHNFQQPSL